MKPLYFYLTLLLPLFLLASCAQAPTPSAPTPTPMPASPYDGKWEGTGRTADGKEVIISFRIESGAIAGIQYQYAGPNDIPCFIMRYSALPPDERPALQGDGFSIRLGPDMDVTANFDSETAASGHLAAVINYRYETCNGQLELDWTAARESAPVAPPVSKPKPTPPNPFETLIQILVFGLSNGAVLALNAIGVSLIYSTVRTLNLAHGDVFALTTVVVTSTVNAVGIQRDWPPGQLTAVMFLLFGLAVVVGAMLSMGVNQLGFKPFRGHSRLAPLIATLGLSFILFQGALVWRTFQASWIPGEHRSAPGTPEVPTDGIPSFLPEINLVQALGLPFHLVIRFSDVFVLVMALVFAGVAAWFLQRTATGRAIRAIAQNQPLAQILGVNVDRTINRAFAMGGALAGAAAFIFALYYGRPFGTHGAQSGLLAFTAALLGGVGSPIGALVSALIIGVFSSLSDYYLSAQWTTVLLLVLLIALIVWRPGGLTSAEDAGAESASVRDSVILTAPGSSSRAKRWLVVLLIALAVLPLLFEITGFGGQVILRVAGIFILLTLGLNLALGLAGLLDLGFAASFGIGAYAGALLGKLDFTFVLLGGAAAGALFGWLKGALAHRARGEFLAVVTLALGLMMRQLILNLDFTGGAQGLNGLPAPHFLDLRLAHPTGQLYLVLGVVALAAWGSHRLIAARTGRAWIASSEDEPAALASGVNVPRLRTLAFVMSSALAGAAGVLYANTLSYVDPDIFSFHISSLTLSMVVLGGAGNVPGAILGALGIVLYDKVIVPQIGALLALIWPSNFFIGAAPDIRGASYFNFGIALYLTVWLRARRK